MNLWISLCWLSLVFSEEAVTHRTCLTWNIDQKYFSLICRVDNIFLPVSFYNQHWEEQAGCSFFMSKCMTVIGNGRITSHLLNRKISLEIRSNENKFDGNWKCVQGDVISTTEVSTAKGIVSDTDIDIRAQIKNGNTTKLILTCSSCREPNDNYAEILINNKSVDGIQYHKATKRCFHIGGQCSQDLCSCSPSGNMFMRTLKIQDNNKIFEFSCQMNFVDDLKSYDFLITATMLYNGREIVPKGQYALAPQLPETFGENKEKIFLGFTLKIVAPMVCLLVVCVVLGGTLYFIKISKKHKKTHSMIEVADEKNVTTEQKSVSTCMVELTVEENLTQDNQVLSSFFCDHCLAQNENKIAILWCMECGEALCPGCKNHHKAMQICRGHKLVEISKVPAHYKMNSETYCIDHSDCKHDYFCQKDNELLCKECLEAKHHPCSNPMPLLTLNIEGKISQSLENINHKIANIRERLTDMETAMENADIIETQTNRVHQQEQFINFVSAHGSSRLLFLMIHSKTKQVLEDVEGQIRNMTDNKPLCLEKSRLSTDLNKTMLYERNQAKP